MNDIYTLAERGYRLFPCVAGAKVPLVTGWVQHASSQPEQLDLWLEQYPHANWGIATDGLLVVDCDPGAEGWPSDGRQATELASTPVIALTPRGGRHYYFRQPAGANYRNTQNGELAEHVDTRASGGYVAIPPSQVNGVAYRWLNGVPDIGPSELPIAPAWVLAKLDDAGASRAKFQVQGSKSEEAIPEGRRNGTLTRHAGALRRVGGTEAAILAAIRQTNADRCKPPLGEKDLATIAASVARYAPADVDSYLAQYAASEESESADDSPNDPGALPADLLHVPGFINDVMEWNLRGAFKPQPALALGGALALLAALTGRNITDAQGARTNLYCLGVSGTSTGKERARVVNKEILYHAWQELIGSESIGSAQGLIAAVAAQPNILFQLDEFGRYLRTMSDAAGSPHLFNIVSVLMRMFTDSASIFKSDAVADMSRVKTIVQPHACIYATTTPAAFFNSLTADSLQDGFLSRVLVFEGDENAIKRSPVKGRPPEELIEQATWWSLFAPGGNMAREHPQPLIVEATSSARRVMDELDEEAQRRQRQAGELLGSLWPRAAEKANKLALLYACSENRESPIVTDAAATWAVELVTHLTARLTWQAGRWVSENRDERSVKRMLRLIEAAGAAGMPKSALTRATQWLKRRERDECLQSLIESRQVRLDTLETPTKPRTVYRHCSFRENFNSSKPVTDQAVTEPSYVEQQDKNN